MTKYYVYAAHRGQAPGANGITTVDPDTGEIAGTVSLGTVAPLALAHNGEGRITVLVDDSVEARTLDTGRFAITGTFDLDGSAQTRAPWTLMRITEDNTRLYLASSRAVLAVEDGRDPVAMESPREDITEIATTADDTSLYARTANTILRFDTTTGALLATSPTWAYRSFAVHPDGSAVYATAGELLLRLDGTTLAPTVEKQRPLRTEAHVAVAPDGRNVYLASVTAGLLDMTQRLDPVTLEQTGTVGHAFAQGRRWAPDGRLASFGQDTLAVMEFTTDGRLTATQLPGEIVDIAFAGPPGRQNTRLEATAGPLLVPVRIDGLTARLTTERGVPISGEKISFASASGRHLATATTGNDGRAQADVEAYVPLDPATGQPDTTTLTGPYTGRTAYAPARTTTDTDPA
ncbi:YncE family protein [Kitasatospora purpeofusca]|uniref:YncE family protein n=1 Tax=Kitasatospora purpeofusca TaxID=67352 RepID=UPI0036ECD7B3